MFWPLPDRNAETAATMPGRSGHESVRTSGRRAWVKRRLRFWVKTEAFLTVGTGQPTGLVHFRRRNWHCGIWARFCQSRYGLPARRGWDLLTLGRAAAKDETAMIVFGRGLPVLAAARCSRPVAAQRSPARLHNLDDQPGMVPNETTAAAGPIPAAVIFYRTANPGHDHRPHLERFLYRSGTAALRYGIGVGRGSVAGLLKFRKQDGPTGPTTGNDRASPTCRASRPAAPASVGARALSRRHGLSHSRHNQPHTIGSAVSSAAPLVNNVIDLFERVPVGFKVVVRQRPEIYRARSGRLGHHTPARDFHARHFERASIGLALRRRGRRSLATSLRPARCEGARAQLSAASTPACRVLNPDAQGLERLRAISAARLQRHLRRSEKVKFVPLDASERFRIGRPQGRCSVAQLDLNCRMSSALAALRRGLSMTWAVVSVRRREGGHRA